MNKLHIIPKLSPIDWITIALCVWMLAFIAFGFNRAERPFYHFLFYLNVITGVLFLAWLEAFMVEFSKSENCSNRFCNKVRPLNAKIISFIRQYYPIILYYYFFIYSLSTNRVLIHQWLDPFFIKVEMALWGYLPTAEWAARTKTIWFKELMYFSYFCYYPMIVGLPIYFYVAKRNLMKELVFLMSLVFYSCYFIYSWLPVIGGRFIPKLMEKSLSSQGGPFSSLMAFIYAKTPHLGGAFPSSHVAIAVVLSLFTFKQNKRLGSIMIIISLLLSISTVYCHYHWSSDAIFGLLFGLLGFFIGEKVYHVPSEKNNV